ncbi:MAG: redoxin domain-containing protein [Saprospiraceae bacterium]|nr:redoxin domain-containing protein [Saprospiraceae bacterium]
MKYSLIAFLFATLFIPQGNSQDNAQGHFLVEFAKFTPPIQDLIRTFEGQPAELFLANDVKGVEHYLPNYKGKKVLLWFWSVDNAKAKEQINALLLLQERNKDFQLISFATETKTTVQQYLREFPMEMVVIPNGEVFGQMAYGADLGSPRIFIIDEFGVIKAVIPEEAFDDNSKLLISLESILHGL